MKSTLTLLLFLISFGIFAQLPKNDKGEVVFTEVVSEEGVSKDELYKRAKLWIVSTLKSGDNMVELTGDNSDQIVGTGNLSFGTMKVPTGLEPRNAYVNFKFIVFCKEGRYKYEVSNFLLSYISYLGQKPKKIEGDLINFEVPHLGEKKANEVRTVMREIIKQKLDGLIVDFKSSMHQSTNDDW